MAVFTGNGSQAAPSFTFSSDTDTGIYRRAANELAFVTAGTERAFFDSTGQLGLNMVPSDRLSVNGGIDVTGTNTLNLGSDQGGGATLGYDSGGSLDIKPRSGYRTRMVGGENGLEIRSNTPSGHSYLYFNSQDGSLGQHRDVGWVQAAAETIDGWGMRFGVRPQGGPAVTSSGLTGDGDFWTGASTFATGQSQTNTSGATKSFSCGGLRIVSRTDTLANTGTAFFDVTLPGSFTGHLYINHALISNASTRTHAVHYLSGRLGNVFTTTLLNSNNGSSGGIGYTVGYAGTANNLRVTSTYSGPAGSTSMTVTAVGTVGF